MPEIVDRFKISGRGIVVVASELFDAPSGIVLSASVTQIDGSTIQYEAWKESPIRKGSDAKHNEAFLLIGADLDAVPIGATITLCR